MKRQSSILTTYYNSRLPKAQGGVQTPPTCPEGFSWNEQRQACTLPDGRTLEELKASNDATWSDIATDYAANVGKGALATVGAGALAIKAAPLFNRFTDVNKRLKQIELEGKLANLSDWDIARRQMSEVGITSGQRAAYNPITSPLANKYVYPYGYTGMDKYPNKLAQIWDAVKSGGFKKTGLQITPSRGDSWRLYLGMPQEHSTFEVATTAPFNHPSYKPGELSKLETFSISPNADGGKTYESIRPIDIFTYGKNGLRNELGSETLVNRAIKLSTGPMSIDVGHDVMGGYNKRLSSLGGLEYNDVWNLEPEITISNYLPRFFTESKIGQNLLYDVVKKYDKKSGGYITITTPKTIKIDVGKFVGKPFFVHGVMQDFPSKEIFTDDMLQRLEAHKQKLLQQGYKPDMPNVKRVQKTIDKLNKGSNTNLSAGQRLRQAAKNAKPVATPTGTTTRSGQAARTEVARPRVETSTPSRIYSGVKGFGNFLGRLFKEVGKREYGGMITDPMGQWKYPGMNTRIPGGNITMQGVPYPVLAMANNGMTTMMQPGQNYYFPGADYVDEYPMMQNGGDISLPNVYPNQMVPRLDYGGPLVKFYKGKMTGPNIFEEGGQSNKYFYNEGYGVPQFQEGGDVPKCPDGEMWDPVLQKCVPMKSAGQRLREVISSKKKLPSLKKDPISYLSAIVDYNKTRVGNTANEIAANLSDYWEGLNKYSDLMKDEIPENIQETDAEKILKKPENDKVDIAYGYNEYGQAFDEKDKKKKFAKFTYTFDNDTGARYVVGNKVKEVTEGGAKKHFKNVKAVAHFLRDSDILPNQKFAPSEWTVHGGIKFKSQTPGKTITSVGFDRPDWYRTLYKPNPSNPEEYLVKYVKNKDITKEEEAKLKKEGWALDFTVSGQSKFSDVDWEGEGPSTKYGVVSRWLPLKNGNYLTIPYKDKKGFSRFSGGSITYLFKHPKTGKSIGIDVAGSVNDMKVAGENLIKKYNLKPDQLEFVFHDMGSYSAKPKATDKDELDYDQWIYFNNYNRGFSGAPLMIPSKKYGGVASFQNGGEPCPEGFVRVNGECVEIEIANAAKQAEDYITGWYNSPKYKQRFAESLSPGEEYMIQGREQQLADVPNIKWASSPGNFLGITNPKKDKNKKIYLNLKAHTPQTLEEQSLAQTAGHEIHHIINKGGKYIPQKTIDFLNSIRPNDFTQTPFYQREVAPFVKTKRRFIDRMFGTPGSWINREEVDDMLRERNREENWYQEFPFDKPYNPELYKQLNFLFNYYNPTDKNKTEPVSFWNKIRQDAKELGVYDPYTEDFDEQKFQKFLEMGNTPKTRDFRKLIDWYGKDNVIEGMNKVVKMGDRSENLSMAKNGGPGPGDKEKKEVRDILFNLPIGSSDIRYPEYQGNIKDWGSNLDKVKVVINSQATGSVSPGRYVSFNTPAPEEQDGVFQMSSLDYPYRGSVLLNPSLYTPIDNERRVVRHELIHGAFDSDKYIPNWLADNLRRTARNPYGFETGEHHDQLVERVPMIMGTRKEVLDYSGLPLNTKVPRDVYNSYLRGMMETGLRTGRPVEPNDVKESLFGARTASDVYNLMNMEMIPEKRYGGISKFGPGGQTTDGCKPYHRKNIFGQCVPENAIYTPQPIRFPEEAINNMGIAMGRRPSQPQVQPGPTVEAARKQFQDETTRQIRLRKERGIDVQPASNRQASIGQARQQTSTERKRSDNERYDRNLEYAKATGAQFNYETGDVAPTNQQTFGSAWGRAHYPALAQTMAGMTPSGDIQAGMIGARSFVEMMPGTSQVLSAARLGEGNYFDKNAGFWNNAAGALGLAGDVLNVASPLGFTKIPGNVKQYITTQTPLKDFNKINPFNRFRGGKNFKSEIDWRNWVKYKEDFDNNPNVIAELYDIEKAAKQDGSWMKNADGTPFQGTPEQFVVQRSSRFKNAFGKTKLVDKAGNPIRVYHGTRSPLIGDRFSLEYFGKTDQGWWGKGLYTSPELSTARHYAFGDKPVPGRIRGTKWGPGEAEAAFPNSRVYELYGNTENPIAGTMENKRFIRENFGRGNMLPNDAVTVADNYELGNTDINNLYEVVFKSPNQLKSAVGNILFDMSNPNIYKSVVPIAGGITALGAASMKGKPQEQLQKYGGSTSKNYKHNSPLLQFYYSRGSKI